MKRSPFPVGLQRRRLVLSVVFLAALSILLNAEETDRRVAVLDFESVGIPLELAIEAQHAVERALYEVRGLRLIERTRIDLLIREQEMQLSDLADQDTAVEVGRLLAANTVVTGVVARPEDPWLTVKVLDVETGAVLFVGDASVGRRNRIPAVARRLSRSAEKILFPERYEPLLLTLGSGAQMAIPFTTLAELVTVGPGVIAYADLENPGVNNLILGLRTGLSFLPGRTENTNYFMSIPMIASAGYRWDVLGPVFIQPTLIAGVAANVLSWDPDGYVVGFDDPVYELEAEIVPLLGLGVPLGYPSKSWNLKVDVETIVMFERSTRMILLSVSIGVYRLVYNSGQEPQA